MRIESSPLCSILSIPWRRNETKILRVCGAVKSKFAIRQRIHGELAPVPFDRNAHSIYLAEGNIRRFASRDCPARIGAVLNYGRSQ